MKTSYKYSALVVKVIDGDTIDCVVDLGFNTSTKERFRLYGVDTPEKNSNKLELKDLSNRATQFVVDTIGNKEVFIDSMGKDKYGRWLAKIYLDIEQPSINEQLISSGLAKSYFGENKINLGW